MDWKPYLEESEGNRDRLVVLLHGYNGAGDRLAAVRAAIHNEYVLPDADVFTPALPVGALQSIFSPVKAEAIVAEVVAAVDDIVDTHNKNGRDYKEINIVGYSFGAVLARKVLVIAFGEQRDDRAPTPYTPTPFEPEFTNFRTPRKWANSIKRLVLLAGMNRGWSSSSATDWLTSAKWGLKELTGCGKNT